MGSNPIQFTTQTQNPSIPSVTDISVQDVVNNKTKARLIDVRRPDEWTGELGHIAEAELMTLDTLPQKINDLNKDETIIFICRSGARSAQATAFAKQQGFKEVYNMAGGMLAWNQANLEVVEQNANR
ncbi:MAG: rhodanese-like domain-containing protein [Bdellovibrionota bacterium]